MCRSMLGCTSVSVSLSQNRRLQGRCFKNPGVGGAPRRFATGVAAQGRSICEAHGVRRVGPTAQKKSQRTSCVFKSVSLERGRGLVKLDGPGIACSTERRGEGGAARAVGQRCAIRMPQNPGGGLRTPVSVTRWLGGALDNSFRIGSHAIELAVSGRHGGVWAGKLRVHRR